MLRHDGDIEKSAALVALPLAGLKKFLKKHAAAENLAVIDPKLGNLIKDSLGLNCIYSQQVLELSRGVRHQLQGLIR